MWAFCFASTRLQFMEMQRVGHLEIILYKVHLELANITDFRRAAINKELSLEAGTHLKTISIKYHVKIVKEKN